MISKSAAYLTMWFCCAQNAFAEKATIAAAASLADVLAKAQSTWSDPRSKAIVFNFDASSRLARQINEGMAVDAMFSADEEWLDFLVKGGKIDRNDKRAMVGNTLVLIAPAHSKAGPSTARSFDFSKAARLALAGESVPAGKYAIAALKRLGSWASMEKKITYGENVRTVLNWIVSGNLPFGMVYYSDALAAGDQAKVIVRDFNGLHPEIIYFAGVTRASKQRSLVEAFFDYCQSDQAQAIFAMAGFSRPPESK